MPQIKEPLPDALIWLWLSSLDQAGPRSLFPLMRALASQSDPSRSDNTQDPCSQDAGSIYTTDPFSKSEVSACEYDKSSYMDPQSYINSYETAIYIEGARKLYTASEKEILACGITPPRKAAYIASYRDPDRIRAQAETISAMGIRMIPYISPDYPDELRQLYDPPLCLYVKGLAPGPHEVRMSMVGARSCSEYGRGMTRQLARTLALSGVSIVSGMARGIDSASHWGCLDAEGRTYAVMGCGPDFCYPRENQELYRQIRQAGGILSEYPPGTPPAAWRFPMRNRIIAALSSGIVVVEARRRSGSLITAERGLELGREIYAIPGRMDDTLSRGCNDLIRAGAQIVTQPEDILEDFGLLTRRSMVRKPPQEKLERKIYASISLVPRTADEICALTREKSENVMKALITLELSDHIRCVSKNQYVLNV